MRRVSDQAAEVIRDGGFTFQWVADLMYDGERRLSNVPIEVGPSLQWDGSRFVVGSGDVRVVWADDWGRDGVPRDVGDWFAPFGAELQIDCIIGAGVFSERVPMGRFVIVEIPDVVEANMLWQGRLIHPGQSFTVSLRDRLVKVQRDGFPYPTASRSESAWDEVQALTGLPVVRNVPDVSIPSTPYEGSREEAVRAIFDRLDAWPHLDPYGALTSRPKSWPDPVDVFRDVVSAPQTLTSTATFNRVVVVGKSPTGDPLYGVREVRSGFLRTENVDGSQSPFGGATYPYRNEKLSTQGEVDGYANDLLPRVARLRTRTRTVTEPFNPTREVGDVLTFEDTARWGTDLMRIVSLSHDGGETTSKVEVADA